MRRPPEDDLFTRFRDGREAAALAKVFDLLAPQLLRIAGHLSGRVDEAEDLVQQTFLVAIERAATWDSRLGLFPWLIGILTNQARLRRRSAARAIDPERLRATPSEPPDTTAERGELTTAIARAVLELGEVYQPVLHLHLFHGLNAKEIGAALGRPAGSVRTQIVRGLEHLRRALPVGLGIAAVTAIGSGRGLAAMREVVLARAIETGAVAGAGVGAAAALGGLLAMKKTVVVFSALLATLLGTLVFWPRAPGEAPMQAGAGRDGVALTHVPVASGTADGGAVAPAPAVSRTPAPAIESRGTLRVTVHGPLVQKTSLRESIAVSGTGDPLGGVLVLAWPGPADAATDDRSSRRSLTDQDGIASLSDLAVGTWRIQARARTRAESAVQTVVITAAATSACDLDIPMAGRVQGRVVDEVGRAVSEAEIWAGDDITGQAETPDHLLRLATRSAADGTFTASHAAGEERIAARKSGYAASLAHPTATLGDGEVTLVLRRGGASVAGVVVDADERPVADAIVGMQLLGEQHHRADDGTLLAPHLPALLRTDREGRFAADDLAPGSYTCRVGSPRHVYATTQFAVAGGGHRDVRIQLEPAVAFAGRVRDPDGNGVVGSYVWIATNTGGAITTRTGHDGRFAFPSVPAPPFVVAAARRANSSVARHAVAGTAAEDLTCELTLEQLPAIRGRVHTDTGAPLAGWRVAALDAAGASLASVATGGDGRFALEDLGTGQFTVVVRQAGDARGEPACTQVGVVAGGEPLELVVPAGALPQAAILGRVVATDGGALTDVWIELVDADGTRGVPTPVEGGVDGEGTFRFEALAQGTYTVVASSPGRLRSVTKHHVAHAQTLDVGALALGPEASLRVRYLRPDGTPWRNRPPVPWLQNEGGEWLMAGRGGDVAYAIDGDEVVVTGLPAGRYQLHGPQGDELVIATREVTLIAGATARLEIPVAVGRYRTLRFATPPKTDPAPALHVEVRDASGEILLRTDMWRGFSTSFAHTQAYMPGRYEVSAHTDAGTRYAWTFDVDTRRRPKEIDVPIVR